MISLKDIQCYILDMDGTIYLGEQVLPGAIELLRLFDKRGIPYYFFTNNSSKSADSYIEKLERLGFGTYTRKYIITSVDVTADYIKKTYGTNVKAFVLGTPDLFDQLGNAGVDCDPSGMPDCVVVGFDTTLCYDRANKALELLRQGVPFIGVNMDAVCPLEGGKVLLDCGSICAMLTHASGVKPKFMGKPFAETAEYIKNITNIPLDKTAVLGDRLYTDMRLAVDNDMCSVGFLSGEMTQSDIDESDMTLDYIFRDALELFENLK
jgi:HAD superfamily hydrolase (TIGR01450 family)